MSRHEDGNSDGNGAANPLPAARDTTLGNAGKSVKENYPHSFATPLTAPNEVDLRRFWHLERPLDLGNAFDRDTLHCWIQQSIDQSCDWIDVRKSCQEREPLDAAVHQAMLDEAYALLAYKRACMALLATLEEPPAPRSARAKAVKPWTLTHERYAAAWYSKRNLR
jgi:hypothetical protein